MKLLAKESGWDLGNKIRVFFQAVLFLLLLMVSIISAFADHYDKATYYLVFLIFLVVVDEKVNP